MARANNGGWDFVHVGGVYRYSCGGLDLVVTVTEDTGDNDYYRFALRVVEAPGYPARLPGGEREFHVVHHRNPGGCWPGMDQFYEVPAHSPAPLEGVGFGGGFVRALKALAW